MESASSDNNIQKVLKSGKNIFGIPNEITFLMFCTFFAFLIRYLLIPAETVLTPDGGHYANLGQKLVSGDLSGGVSGYWSPLYPIFMAAFSLVFQDMEFAGRMVSAFAGSALVIPLYFLICEFYGKRAAVLGVFLLIFQLPLIESSGWVLTESLYTLIFTSVVLTGWYALKSGSGRIFFLIGMLFGAAYLTKPEAAAFIGLFLIIALAAYLINRNFTFRRLMAGYLLLLLGVSLFMLPYVLAVYGKTGEWTLSQKIYYNLLAPTENEKSHLALTDDGQSTVKDRIIGNVYQTEHQKADISSTDSEPDSGSGGFESKYFVGYTLSSLKRELKEYIPMLLPYPLILLVIVGFFSKPWTKLRSEKEFYLFSFFFCTLLGYAAAATEFRYLLAIAPILICWASNGIIEFSDWISRSTSNFFDGKYKIKPLAWQVTFVIISIVIFMLPAFSSKLAPIGLESSFEDKWAGQWIREQTTSSPLIMAPTPVVAYYAGGESIFMPDEEFSVVLEYAKRKKVNYLFFSQRRSEKTPKFKFPKEQSLPEGIRLVHQEERISGNKTFIYHLSE